MEGDSSQSFLGSLIKSLSSVLAETESEKEFASKASEEIGDDELDWMENATQIDDQDMVDSINIHKRILDSEIDTIDKELGSIVKNRETVDYLISLLRKREKLEHQVHQLEGDLNDLQIQNEG